MKHKNYHLYQAYLKTPEWKAIRLLVINERKGKCERCGSTEKLEVHHKTYKNLFNEPLEDLELLCKVCHTKHHNKTNNKRKNKKKRYKKKFASTVWKNAYAR